MGLGKTVQTIAVIDALIKKRMHIKPFIRNCIIMTPTSLLNNWRNEFMKWLPSMKSMVTMNDGSGTSKICTKCFCGPFRVADVSIVF